MRPKSWSLFPELRPGIEVIKEGWLNTFVRGYIVFFICWQIHPQIPFFSALGVPDTETKIFLHNFLISSSISTLSESVVLKY